MKIATLGWGSVLWDNRPEFAEFNGQHGAWVYDGPILPLEFCRISGSRNGALTLVIDAEVGAACRVAYALTRRTNLNHAIEDLRRREKTRTRKIGYLRRDRRKSNARDANALQIIQDWLTNKPFDAVVWTDLEREFSGQFSVDRAIVHLNELSLPGKQAAAEYVRRAPGLIHTPLRTALRMRGHAAHEFSHKEISEAAYFIRENTNRALGLEEHGRDREDWFAAKDQLRDGLAWWNP